MEITDVLTITVSTLITVVLAHLAVYWVVKTLYPPVAPPPVPLPPVPVTAPPAYVPPPVEEQAQHVELPTYEARVPAEAPREERKGPPPPEPTSIRGPSGVDTPNA